MSIVNRVAGFILGLVFGAIPAAFGGIMPSFEPERCIEAATDIVVASQISNAGEVSILETWKGDLKKGDKLTLSHLPATPLRAFWLRSAANSDRTINGKRIILFLKPSTDPALHDKYIGAATGIWNGLLEDETPTSAVWINGSNTYAFEQVYNPGPSVPVVIETTESQLKSRVLSSLNSTQADFRKAIRIPDIDLCIRELIPLTASSTTSVRSYAIAALGNCGEEGLRELGIMFSIRQSDLDLIVDAIAKAAGPNSDYELDRLLLDECVYWKAAAPLLNIGWQTEKEADGSPRYAGLSIQYRALKYTLDKFTVVKRDDHYTTVREIRDFWLATPQLNDETDPIGVIATCKRFLGSLDKQNPSIAP